MGKVTISLAIVNSYFDITRRSIPLSSHYFDITRRSIPLSSDYHPILHHCKNPLLNPWLALGLTPRLQQNHGAYHDSPEAQEVVLGVGHNLRIGKPASNRTWCSKLLERTIYELYMYTHITYIYIYTYIYIHIYIYIHTTYIFYGT